MPKIAVVGAGIGGLATAIRLQYAGYQVDLYEKNAAPGGKMSQLKIDGFTFDVGPTIVMMPDIYKRVFTETGVNPDDYFKMSRVEPFMDVFTKDGQDQPLSSDLVKIAENFESSSYEDMAGFLKYLSDIYDRYLVAKNHFIERSFRKPSDFWNPKSLIQGLKLKTFSSSYQSLQKFIKSEDIVKLMAFQTLYIGISPYNGPSIYNIIPMIELMYGVWFIEGGMYQYVNALVKRFEELGGKLHVNTTVDEVTFTGKTATGVAIAGQQYAYDSVVVNADFPFAMKELIKAPAARGKYTPAKIDKMDYAISCFVIYLGVDRKYDHLNLHTLRMADDFFANIEQLETGKLPEDPSFYLYTPSQLDASMAPEGQESLYILAPVPNLRDFDAWTPETIAAFKDQVLQKAAQTFKLPDLQDHIVVEKIYTPNSFATEFNSAYGATFGLKPTLKQSNYFRPHNKYPYADNLYFSGASVHPGAGVPIVLTSGMLTAQEVQKDLSVDE